MQARNITWIICTATSERTPCFSYQCSLHCFLISNIIEHPCVWKKVKVLEFPASSSSVSSSTRVLEATGSTPFVCIIDFHFSELYPCKRTKEKVLWKVLTHKEDKDLTVTSPWQLRSSHRILCWGNSILFTFYFYYGCKINKIDVLHKPPGSFPRQKGSPFTMPDKVVCHTYYFF